MKLIKLLFIIFISYSSFATTIIRLVKPDKEEILRHQHPNQVLKLALDKTISKYGDYRIEYTVKMTRNRALRAINNQVINVYDAPTRQEWEENALPIYFPISKGLLSYRLLLVNKNSLQLFSKVNTVGDLKKLRAGLGSQWSTTRILKAKDFNIIIGNRYENLFSMLEADRFDYFLRGVNEIFGEYETFKKTSPSIVIEKEIVAYIFLPIYFFVSPKQPKLAKRIKEGLELALKDGSFNKLFYKNYGQDLKKAKIKARRMLQITPKTNAIPKQISAPKYWLNFH